MTYPVCLNTSATRSAFQAFQDTDVSIVIDQQGIIQYKKAGVNIDEIKSVVNGLLATSIEDENDLSQSPTDFALYQNYPNPFNPQTTINFQLANESRVLLNVYNALGQKVATLLDDLKAAGNYSIPFNAQGLPSGVYFYELQAGEYIAVKKMVLLE